MVGENIKSAQNSTHKTIFYCSSTAENAKYTSIPGIGTGVNLILQSNCTNSNRRAISSHLTHKDNYILLQIEHINLKMVGINGGRIRCSNIQLECPRHVLKGTFWVLLRLISHMSCAGSPLHYTDNKLNSPLFPGRLISLVDNLQPTSLICWHNMSEQSHNYTAAHFFYFNCLTAVFTLPA